MSAGPLPVLGPSSAVGRWVGLGPYYAMFPSQMPFSVIEEYCPPDGAVLDPFAGRASSIYAAVALGRTGWGVEINPVGWLYGRVKTRPAARQSVLDLIHHLGELAGGVTQDQVDSLPPFFLACYAPRVLRYLLAARQTLDWKTNQTAATLMAIILVHLHGKRSQSLSNQMRQSRAMSPEYCIRWWRERKSLPPDIDPVCFLVDRVEWRYAKGIPNLAQSRVILGDAVAEVPQIKKEIDEGSAKPFSLLLTSPPYYSITNYNYDQWIRMWMLGWDDRPVRTRGMWQSKFDSRARYADLLTRVFGHCSEVLDRNATVYVRTDARSFTYETTIAILSSKFPGKKMAIIPRPLSKHNQTALFGDKSPKPGEVDIILE